MAHHKRKRPKSRRSGCLHCKPHKGPGGEHQNMKAKQLRWREQEREGHDTAFVSLEGS